MILDLGCRAHITLYFLFEYFINISSLSVTIITSKYYLKGTSFFGKSKYFLSLAMPLSRGQELDVEGKTASQLLGTQIRPVYPQKSPEAQTQSSELYRAVAKG